MKSNKFVNPDRLNKKTLYSATDYLCKIDNDLNKIIDQYGYPPLWARPANFSTLIQIILEQQVSLSSANATFTRLKKTVPSITAENLIKITPEELNQLGFTRQKASYCLGLAQNILDKEISLQRISKLDANIAFESLVKIRGIGKWSAKIYLLMALRHPDIWPQGDLALNSSVYKIKRLRRKPSEERIDKIVSKWQPWRSVAARILWHYYLSK